MISNKFGNVEDAPRTLKSSAEQARRRELLLRPHMVPLVAYVAELRSRNLGAVPDFDPCDGGVNARALFLFEKPGPKAFETGFISRNNDDVTAENTFHFMQAAGLPREHTCLWNVIPFWNGTIKVTASELSVSIACLRDLLGLFSRLRAVVLVGRKAEMAIPLLTTMNFPVVTSFHPSPKNYALAREKWLAIPHSWAKVKAHW